VGARARSEGQRQDRPLAEAKNGDSVEILTSPTSARTGLARVREDEPGAGEDPHNFIKQQQRERSLEIGRDLLEREFRRLTSPSKMVKTSTSRRWRTVRHARRTFQDAVGYGSVSRERPAAAPAT
jgi:GTP pyrophosphokinase